MPFKMKSMKTASLSVPIALAFALFAPFQFANAQKFQEPTKEELQMISDSKAPGAPAVFLYREEVTDNYSHYVSSYARIKVLTEQGKSWAHVEFLYNPGESAPPILEARTIHSDGAVIPLAGKAADLLTYKPGKENTQIASFDLPGAEVGSILEYRWTIPLTQGKLNFPVSDEETPLVSSWVAREIPVWKVQQQIYVHKEHFYYNPHGPLDTSFHPVDPTGIQGLVDGERSTHLFNTQHLPPGVQFTFTAKGDYVFDIQDVPAIPHPFASPAEGSVAYQVIFFYSPYPTVEAYWQEELKRWSKILRRASEPTQAIQEAASQMTLGAATPEAKARKLYDAVQALDNTGFHQAAVAKEQNPLTLLGTRQKTADAVWKAKGGAPNDIALLYLALARAAGIDAYGIQVVDRSQRSFDPNYLSLRQFEALLVVLRIDGKEVPLDPGEKLCPFGQLHWSHLRAGGLSENDKTPIFTGGNLSKDAITAHRANLAIDAHGVATGSINVLMSGPEALRWRQLNLTVPPTELQRQFEQSLNALLPPGISARLDHFEGLDSSAGSLLAVVKVSGQLGNATQSGITIPAFFFATQGAAQFATESNQTASPDRTIPMDFHYAGQALDDVTYQFPAGFTVQSSPHPAQIAWPDHAALVTTATPNPNSIVIKHIFARTSILLDAKEYPALRDYYQKLADNDRKPLVLTPAPNAKGN